MKYPNEVILYVDDEWTNCVVFEQTFRKDFNIQCVRSADEALDVLAQKHVAVVISDQRMPGMSGNDLLAIVRKQYPDIVRIVLTAFADGDPVLRAINEGLVARYIVKPWDVEELKEVLGWAVEAHVIGRTDSSLHSRLVETERLVTLGRIAASTIHDMAQPLGYLQMNSTVLGGLAASMPALKTLVERHQAELSESDLENLTQLAESLSEMASDMMFGCRVMSGNLAEVSRFVAKASDPRGVRSTEPHAILRYAFATCRNLASNARANIVYRGDPSLPRVKIGATELAQVMINLLSNASQAVERRGTGGTITVIAQPHGDQLDLVVEDDGPGIPADLLPKLGTPFTTTRTDGTGLGIAQAKRLLHASGGDLRFFSTKGVGTRVVISLPLAGN